MQLTRLLSHRTGVLGDVAETPATPIAASSVSICWHVMSRQGVDCPAQPMSLLSPEPTQTALHHPWESWGWGGGNPLGARRQMGRIILTSVAEVGHHAMAGLGAGC